MQAIANRHPWGWTRLFVEAWPWHCKTGALMYYCLIESTVSTANAAEPLIGQEQAIALGVPKTGRC
ncbi:hypothetical protein [Candidatus Methylacidiphilum infernorum]|uniref:hypothetical protein n=1 Tax=Candidatus Methylacidiphilum infernorum TaxID=511746 RepID=UPI0011D169BF|nr:hypothetical protein [Candidatus Methylacidiphilum infernorum]